MPIYEYQCRRCGHRFEKLIRNAATATAVTCTQCGTEQVDKQFSTFGVHTGGHSAGAEPAPPFCGRCGENRPPCGGAS